MARWPQSREERLCAKFEIAPDGCWVWTSGMWPGGYGRFFDNSGNKAAHRVAYEIAVGTIPEGLELDHLCRNRACVNPDHLEPVTRAENTRRGSSTKLDAAAVALIKASDLSWAKLGQIFGVTKGTIQPIKQGRAWCDVPPSTDAEAIAALAARLTEVPHA